MQVTKEVAGYDYGIGDDNSWNYMSVLGWPYTSKGSDTTSILQVFNQQSLKFGIK